MKGPWLACLVLGAMIGPLSRARADVIPLEGSVSLVAEVQVNPDPLQYDQTTSRLCDHFGPGNDRSQRPGWVQFRGEPEMVTRYSHKPLGWKVLEK
jgi:hypothetical protein